MTFILLVFKLIERILCKVTHYILRFVSAADPEGATERWSAWAHVGMPSIEVYCPSYESFSWCHCLNQCGCRSFGSVLFFGACFTFKRLIFN